MTQQILSEGQGLHLSIKDRVTVDVALSEDTVDTVDVALSEDTVDTVDGLICREQATAFHMSGRHFLMSSTGMFMNGILMVPLDHSLMSFMAPWSDWTLQLRNSSVGLRTRGRSPESAETGTKENNETRLSAETGTSLLQTQEGQDHRWVRTTGGSGPRMLEVSSSSN
ncbi:hypothetical protein INR49_006595 [Caranx melampygus]|nr:hypothetical protein INR49_006595 [Caranx melampygus]